MGAAPQAHHPVHPANRCEGPRHQGGAIKALLQGSGGHWDEGTRSRDGILQENWCWGEFLLFFCVCWKNVKILK